MEPASAQRAAAEGAEGRTIIQAPAELVAGYRVWFNIEVVHSMVVTTASVPDTT